MTTECNGKLFEFHPLGQREVRAGFDGGAITSDGGGLLLREVEKRTGIMARFAACFTDHRDAERIEHTVRGVGGAAGVRVGAGVRGFERSRRTAAGSGAGGAGGEGRSDGREPGAGAGSRQSAGGQEHAESFRADASGGGGEGALQEDRDGSSGGGPAAGGGLSGVLRGSAARRSFSIWTPRTIRCMGTRKGGSFTVTTGTIAICRCISSAATRCCVRACGRRISMRQRGAWRNWSGS